MKPCVTHFACDCLQAKLEALAANLTGPMIEEIRRLRKENADTTKDAVETAIENGRLAIENKYMRERLAQLEKRDT